MVLVILLVGVFTIIRVFPLGFKRLQQAQSRTTADRLANTLMEQLKADAPNLPQGIVFPSYEPAPAPEFILTEDPDDQSSYAAKNNNPYFTDVNKTRGIIGEGVKVPLPTTSAYGSGSIYALKFGPVYMDRSVDKDTVPTTDPISPFLLVYGAPLRGFNIEAETGNNANVGRYLRTLQNYLIDYDGPNGAQIMFYPSNKDRKFRISFSYLANGKVANKVINDFIVPAAPTSGSPYVWLPIVEGSVTFTDILDGSETVSRDFTRLPSTAGWDASDPYQYKLLSNNVAASSYANVGLIAFNPAGANYSEATTFGQQAFRAYIDYAVLDWHILREDREVPSVFFNSNNVIPLKTTLPYIKRIGDADQGTDTYKGLYSDSSNQVDLQIFDLQGTVARTAANPGLGDPLRGGDLATRDPQFDYWVDYAERGGTYQTGTIYLNAARIKPGSQLRVLYKADGDWAVAVQKAYSRYTQALDNNGFVSPVPTKFDNFGRQGTRLYFNRCDLNKSVTATFQYLNTNGDYVRTQPTLITVDNADGDYAWVDVAGHMPNLKDAASWRVNGAASGASLKVRVIWKDNASESNTWKIQDRDTYLTPTVAGS